MAALSVLLGSGVIAAGQTAAARLPDAPSALVAEGQQQTNPAAAGTITGPTQSKTDESKAMKLLPCAATPSYAAGAMPLQGPPPCVAENPVQSIVTSAHAEPLSSAQKGKLALKEYFDPFNFVTIAGYSAIAVAYNSHSAYGSGMKGWAKLTGYGLLESAQADFFGTYAIPSLVHQDPRYHRMPTASIRRRLWHALAHTVVTRSDSGRPMLNIATLLTYPISAELSNLYVPGIPTNGRATAERVAIGYATDPVPQLVAEFLPDVAKHIHLHAEFAQELIDRAAGVNPALTQ